jgi:DNA polymerase-3 subunit epsilon
MEIDRATGRRLDGRRLCTVKLARKLLPQLRRRSLDYVSMHYGVEITNRHRAGGDALATAQVFVRMLRDARRRGCATWHDLQTLLIAPTPKRRRSRRPPAMPRPVDRDTTA